MSIGFAHGKELVQQPIKYLHTFKQIYQDEILFQYYQVKYIHPFNNPHHEHHRFHRLESFPDVKNLTEWINHIGATKNVLTVIDNWQGVNLDFHSLKSPLIVRSPQPAVIWEQATKEFILAWILQDTKLHVKIKNHTTSVPEIICPTSKYFISEKITHAGSSWWNALEFKDICIKLNATSFSASSKPWSQKIHIAIHLPLHLLSSYPKLFAFSSELNSIPRGFDSSLPSTIPTVYCFVSHLRSSETGYAQIAGLIEGLALKPLFENQDFGVSHDIYIWISVSLDGNLKECHVVRNPGISDFENLQHFHVSSTIHWPPNLSMQSFYNLAYVPKSQPIGFYVWYFADDKMFGAIQQQWAICRNYITHWPRKIVGIPFPSKTDRIAHAYVHLWQSALHNYTIYSNKLSSCENDKPTESTFDAYTSDLSLELKLHSGHKPIYYPVVIEDKINKLRFVACGQRGFSSLQFDQLVSVFDVYIWVLLAATLLILVDVKRRFLVQGKLSHFWKDLLDGVRLFLDQPYLLKQRSYFTGYLLIYRLTLLMGIILTNAYKNTNILKMITTRDFMMYTEFNDLIDHNFTVTSSYFY